MKSIFLTTPYPNALEKGSTSIVITYSSILRVIFYLYFAYFLVRFFGDESVIQFKKIIKNNNILVRPGVGVDYNYDGLGLW